MVICGVHVQRSDAGHRLQLRSPFPLTPEMTLTDEFDAPSFIAGVMWVLTDDVDYSDVCFCYGSYGKEVTDILTAFGEFNSDGYFHDPKKMGDAWHAVISAMATCQDFGNSMDNNIKAIEEFSTVFTHPSEYSTYWVLHGDHIKDFITKMIAAWSAGNYYNAGMDVALAFAVAVGPSSHCQGCSAGWGAA